MSGSRAISLQLISFKIKIKLIYRKIKLRTTDVFIREHEFQKKFKSVFY